MGLLKNGSLLRLKDNGLISVTILASIKFDLTIPTRNLLYFKKS